MPRRPNVILVITDDQGYGDLGCHGNPVIHTPHIDGLHAESVRLTNFHVGPTCAPTRAGLMTGHYCNCTGVWHTIMGRSLLRRDEVTVADVFRANGYRTGMFGKWHLGDNAPFRPHDRGFDEALYHGGGGVSQTPDFWGNDYFDDTYRRNGVPESFTGYCTDVWFDEALKFVDAHREEPFFCYISTNAPHGPYNVDESYAAPYREAVPDSRARFYGMITNIDENVGKLRARLAELGLADDTILIWMTDNGSSGGATLDGEGFVTEGYNAGLRGMKGSPYDGGHRTPFFLRWPAGGYAEGRDEDRLTANVDVLPTLIDLCGLRSPKGVAFSGTSLRPLLEGREWPERVVVTDSQRVDHPVKWRQSAVMTDRWRLVNGTELHDIGIDREQRRDVAGGNPDVVRRLRRDYDAWWDTVSTRLDEYCPIVVGSGREPVAAITGHDWHGEACPWSQGLVRQGVICNGFWVIDVAEAGRYAFELRRWPREENRAIVDGIDGEIEDWYTGGNALPLTHARIRVGGQEADGPIEPDARGVTFTLDLPAGETRMQTWLSDGADLELGAYYVYVERVDP
ncbi:arylsulfatase [bacterium]|nr:arylsulfatase [bacterium]